MSEVSVSFCAMSDDCLRLKVFLRKCAMALASESPLMRCAPHSALISIAGHAPDLFGVGLEEGEVELACRSG